MTKGRLSVTAMGLPVLVAVLFAGCVSKDEAARGPSPGPPSRPAPEPKVVTPVKPHPVPEPPKPQPPEPVTMPLELASPFVNDMILQREMKVPVWGWASTGTEVTVEFASQTKTAVAGDGGRWMLELDPLEASLDEREFKVTAGDESIARTGVLVGEVWFASGQSNMDWFAGRSMCSGLANKLARAKEDVPVREYQVDTGSSIFPMSRAQCKAGWKRARHAGGFSAIALSFAAKLNEELGVPVGILRASHGATPSDTWTPYEGFASRPALEHIALKIRQSDPTTPGGREAYAKYYEDLKEWQRKSEEIVNRGGTAPRRPSLPGIADEWKGASRMFNMKINPLVPYAIRGVIWCQYTSNSGDGKIYAEKMHALVDGLRMHWKRPGLPFYFTQAPAYGSPDPNNVGFADVREVQRKFFMDAKNVGMALQYDLNSARPQGIHNFNKLHPGWRLARWALAHEYSKDIAYTGPIYESHVIEGDKVRVRFVQRGPGGGLMVASKGMAADYRKDPPAYFEPARATPGEKLKHFRLAGADRVWHAAEAEIVGDSEVVVTSKAVPNPVGVQYAYNAVPMGANLYNEAGLPATPFAYFDGKQMFVEEDPKKIAEAKAREAAKNAPPPPPRAYVSVMSLLRTHAVIQRDRPVPIRGFATAGAEVTVSFGGQSKKAVADEFDNWVVTLDPMPASAEGRDLTVTADNGRTRSVGDILVGDVWFLTGGTALGGLIWPTRDKNAKPPEAMPLLREFRIKTKGRRFRTPRRRRMEIGGGRYSSHWLTATFTDPNAGITAAAYHFASQVREEGVPIGIVNMNADNPPLTWISYQGLQTAKGFEKERDELNLEYPNTDACKAAVTGYIETIKKYGRDIVALKAAGKEIPAEMAISAPAFPQPYFNQWSNDTETATHTYNWCIAPNTPYAVRGVVWVPGQKSIGKDVARYASAVAALAGSLPKTYGVDGVRFVFAQPSAGLVEGIAKPEIAGAASVDFDKWPRNMAEIATRLGAAARGK